jgi:hypothetical protein
MNRAGAGLVPVFLVLAGLTSAAPGTPATPKDPHGGPDIRLEDVERFFQIYDSADGHPTGDQLQRDYLDAGSEGLHRFARLRDVSGIRIAESISKRPEIYSGARRCVAALPRVRERLDSALRELGRLYPEASFPPVTIAVGRGKPVGVADASGVMIGLEALCATNWLDVNVEDRFVHVIAHEYAHVQQARRAPALYDNEKPTVLELSLIEGAAEFTAEMISGDLAYRQLRASTQGHELEIESAFAAAEGKTDLSNWLNNSTPEKPGDLGYWVGYRIVKAYYQRAADKRRAFDEILGMTDPKAFLAGSGWYPGMPLK